MSSAQSVHASDRPQNDAASAARPVDIAAALVGPVILLALLIAYLVAPDFYLQHVLSEQHREYQVVELTTFACSVLAGILLLIAGVKLNHRQASLYRSEGGGWGNLLRQRAGAAVVLIAGLAAVFLAGEEISWGQTYLGWDTPEKYADFSGETNLHNADLPIRLQSLGSLFLIVLFIALPLAWRFFKDRLPASLAPAIAEWPVITTIVVAFLWKEGKSVYRIATGQDESSAFYINFIEQFNEHKEMLAAVTLLMYALYRLRAVRKPTT